MNQAQQMRTESFILRSILFEKVKRKIPLNSSGKTWRKVSAEDQRNFFQVEFYTELMSHEIGPSI